MDDWRTLLYPLGFISSLAFGGRVLIQWLGSEKAGRSIVTANFWRLSLLGNLSLLLHSLIQVQYGVALVQTCNAVISWRNLNLMEPKARHFSLSSVIKILSVSAITTTAFFWMQQIISNEPSWFKIPLNPWFETPSHVHPLWHAIGLVGMGLFASRFWVQWWLAEKAGQSSLSRSFWWLSLIGDALSLSYFLHIKDPVNLIGPVLGLVPYIRNLILGRSPKPYATSNE